MEKAFDTPVLIIAFNRPDFAEKVIEAVSVVKPKRLYIAADGPRPDKEGEADQCEETRKAATNVNWDCEVKTLFRDDNIGCGLGPATAISWFFENEEAGIILEDDCIPDPTFFTYCQNLLEKYKDDSRVMHIGGYSIQHGEKVGNASYYFSKYPEVWGWATWRRAWKLFDFEMKSYQRFKAENRILDVFDTTRLQNSWIKALDYTLAEAKPSIWDYRWMYCLWSNHGLCITPNQCLVRNIGFDGRGTHTNGTDEIADTFTSVEITPMHEVVHPELVIPSKAADLRTEHIRITPPWATVIRRKLGEQVSKILG